CPGTGTVPGSRSLMCGAAAVSSIHRTCWFSHIAGCPLVSASAQVAARRLPLSFPGSIAGFSYRARHGAEYARVQARMPGVARTYCCRGLFSTARDIDTAFAHGRLLPLPGCVLADRGISIHQYKQAGWPTR